MHYTRLLVSNLGGMDEFTFFHNLARQQRYICFFRQRLNGNPANAKKGVCIGQLAQNISAPNKTQIDACTTLLLTATHILLIVKHLNNVLLFSVLFLAHNLLIS